MVGAFSTMSEQEAEHADVDGAEDGADPDLEALPGVGSQEGADGRDDHAEADQDPRLAERVGEEPAAGRDDQADGHAEDRLVGDAGAAQEGEDLASREAGDDEDEQPQPGLTEEEDDDDERDEDGRADQPQAEHPQRPKRRERPA